MGPTTTTVSDGSAGAQAPAAAEYSTSQTPVTKTAEIAAVEKHDVGGFRAARAAERAGKPLAAVPAADKAAAAGSAGADDAVDAAAQVVPERKIPKWQAERNEAIRQSVERATADATARIAELEAKLKGDHPAGGKAGEKATNQDYQRLLKHPDAPKLADFEAEENPYAAHAAAMSAFITSTLVAESREAADVESVASEAFKEEKQKIDTFQGHITKAGGKAFLESLAPAVRALRPTEAIKAEAAAKKTQPVITALNVLTSAIVGQSVEPAKTLKHLSDHPEELERFSGAKNQAEVYILFGQLEARLNPLGAASVEKKTVTGFTAQAHSAGTRSAAPADPEAKAVQAHDFQGFRAARDAERRAQRGA